MPRKIKTAAAIVTGDPHWIEGSAGVGDTLTGTAERDTFVIRAGGGDDVITDFQWKDDGNFNVDKVLFDYGAYSDVMFLGLLSDGLQWSSVSGAVWTSHIDGNDWLITVDYAGGQDSIRLVGTVDDGLSGAAFAGG